MDSKKRHLKLEMFRSIAEQRRQFDPESYSVANTKLPRIIETEEPRCTSPENKK